ncbi:RAB31, partial [Cervus elaphus hippelaphus]
DTGVGKSSIVCRFVQDHFDHNISPTIGASFMTKTVPCGNELHKFLIWDTAGQERLPLSGFVRGNETSVPGCQLIASF